MKKFKYYFRKSVISTIIMINISAIPTGWQVLEFNANKETGTCTQQFKKKIILKKHTCISPKIPAAKNKYINSSSQWNCGFDSFHGNENIYLKQINKDYYLHWACESRFKPCNGNPSGPMIEVDYYCSF